VPPANVAQGSRGSLEAERLLWGEARALQHHAVLPGPPLSVNLLGSKLASPALRVFVFLEVRDLSHTLPPSSALALTTFSTFS
jgi:hypothetical protein